MRHVIIYLFIVLSVPSGLFAGAGNDDLVKKQKKFINELYSEKKYFDCVSETQRLLNYNKDYRADDYVYFMNACYYAGGQYKTIIQRLGVVPAGTARPLPDIFLLSRSYLNTGNDVWRKIIRIPDYSSLGKPDREILFANRAEMFLNNYEYLEALSEADAAGKYIDHFKGSALRDFRADMDHYNDIGLKSEWLSVALSAALPGTGQVYSGRIMDGILSFAAVAGSALGALYFYNKDDKPVSMTLAFFTCLFYGGNLYGAYNSASKTNSSLNRQFSESIISKYNLRYDPMDYTAPGLFE